MNNYITLDSKKYMTSSKDWAPVWLKPATDRITLSGEMDVTYGPGLIVGYTGSIIAPVTSPGTGWGTVSDLKTTLAKRTAVTFTAHDSSTAVNVHVLGPFNPASMSPMWDASSNEWHVPVRVLEA
nr:hypothetical protein [Anaerolineae bacterium]